MKKFLLILIAAFTLSCQLSAVGFSQVTAFPGGLTASGWKTGLSLNNVENTALSTWAGTANLVTLGTVTTGTWNATTLGVAYGGTGNTTFTAYGVICAGTTSTGAFQNVSGVGTSGQVLTSNGAGSLPTWQAATGGTAWYTFSTKTGDYTLVASDAVINNKASTQFVATLPATAAVGDHFWVVGKNATKSWRISQNASQTIFYGDQATTTGTGGYVENVTEQHAAVEFFCITANTEFVMVSATGVSILH